jgi:hypothetical protein
LEVPGISTAAGCQASAAKPKRRRIQWRLEKERTVEVTLDAGFDIFDLGIRRNLNAFRTLTATSDFR